MTSPFDGVAGQPEAVALLERLLRRHPDIPTSYIFQGPEGCGKFLTALRFASALTGQDPSKTASGLAPDILTVDEPGPNIKLETVQGLILRLGLRPAASVCKVAIINDAEKMTREAANSLLKTLEEPPPSGRLILVTSRPDDLLPTVRSRCLRVLFRRLPVGILRDLILRLRPETPPALADETARLSGGSAKAALDLLEAEPREQALRLAREAVRLWNDRRVSPADILRCAEPFQKAGTDGRLIFSHLLDILTLHWRDTLVSAPAGATAAQALRALDLLADVRKDLETNANLRLAFEHILLEVRRLRGPEGRGP